ncbi:MAG: hypothetical protein HC778_05545 [Chamaesiphon sp. CSU_1_12]|nr:hypothetical protein [Chamaesiphon sp. CSU_1_12]
MRNVRLRGLTRSKIIDLTDRDLDPMVGSIDAQKKGRLLFLLRYLSTLTALDRLPALLFAHIIIT